MMHVPFLGQFFTIPHVVRRGSGEQGYRKGMEIEALDKVVDDIGPPTIVVAVVEDIARCLP